MHDPSAESPLEKINNNDLETELFIPNTTKPEITSKTPTPKTKRPLFNILDHLISIFVVSPCVVGFWRGTWLLLDLHVHYFPAWEGFVFGALIHVMFAALQSTLVDIFRSERKGVVWYMFKATVMRIYTYVFAVACNLYWRGGWFLLDKYVGVEMTPRGTVLPWNREYLFGVTVVCFVGVFCLKSLTNCYAPPFAICVDKVESTFVFPNRFRAKMGEKTSLYILDCLFSVLIVGTLVVFVWRGAWAILDIYLSPENEIWSAWSSLIVGYSAVAIAFMLQPFMRWLCERITGVFRLLVADLFLIFSLIGTVNVWRGIWNLLNLYLLPDDLELSCWITHWVCLAILILLGCSNSLLVRGVYIDAEEPGGKCVVFPCYYLRIIFQEQKNKKHEPSRKTEMVSSNNHVQPQEINHKEGAV